MGLAQFNDGKFARVWTEDISGTGPVIRLGQLFDVLSSHLAGVGLVVMEGYAFAAKGMTFQIGEMGGVIRLALLAQRVPFVVVASSSLKKFVMGKGSRPGEHIEKVEVAVAASKRWGITAKNDNEYDAYVLGRIGLGIMGQTEGMIGAQIEVVKKYADEVQKEHTRYDSLISVEVAPDRA